LIKAAYSVFVEMNGRYKSPISEFPKCIICGIEMTNGRTRICSQACRNEREYRRRLSIGAGTYGYPGRSIRRITSKQEQRKDIAKRARKRQQRMYMVYKAMKELSLLPTIGELK